MNHCRLMFCALLSEFTADRAIIYRGKGKHVSKFALGEAVTVGCEERTGVAPERGGGAEM